MVAALSIFGPAIGQESGGNGSQPAATEDPIATLQSEAARDNKAAWGHWGPNAEKYSSWTTHSNRLVPLYLFGGDLSDYKGERSVYRSEESLQELYGKVPKETLNPAAQYFDQTDVYRMQREAAFSGGKKRIILFVFDGLDWQTTRAAAIAKTGEVAYTEGRGTGLAFQDYAKAPTDFGFFVSSPHNNGTTVDLDQQLVATPGGRTPGGYSPRLGGTVPWQVDVSAKYLIAEDEELTHSYTDSAASATSMTTGFKTYNNAINVDFSGRELVPLARTLQAQGFAVGTVSSVPFCHATPACAYANNVHRGDYQDIARDMLGRRSIFHPGGLPGLDVVLGGGWGDSRERDGFQGKNFQGGNRYLADSDLEKIKSENGGQYIVCQRTHGVNGTELLNQATQKAIDEDKRLFGFFGVSGGHLPFQTANGDFQPVKSASSNGATFAEKYEEPDLDENPLLVDLAMAAVEVLDSKSDRWWLLIEAGDVDWANHANNIDDSIGAILSGETTFQRVTQWIEEHGGWEETMIVLTADHGHYFVLDDPEAFVR